MCFVAMPFGKFPPIGETTPLIDFDAIIAALRRF
jgi:hypothetical protein